MAYVPVSSKELPFPIEVHNLPENLPFVLETDNNHVLEISLTLSYYSLIYINIH
jgi:hypothetical protein